MAIALMSLYINPLFAALAHLGRGLLSALGWSIAPSSPKRDAFPFWDSSVAVLSVVAQILMTRKYAENWILWVLTDSISIGLYSAQGIYAVAVQYAILLFIALYGSWLWACAASRNTPVEPVSL